MNKKLLKLIASSSVAMTLMAPGVAFMQTNPVVMAAEQICSAAITTGLVCINATPGAIKVIATELLAINLSNFLFILISFFLLLILLVFSIIKFLK